MAAIDRIPLDRPCPRVQALSPCRQMVLASRNFRIPSGYMPTVKRSPHSAMSHNARSDIIAELEVGTTHMRGACNDENTPQGTDSQRTQSTNTSAQTSVFNGPMVNQYTSDGKHEPTYFTTPTISYYNQFPLNIWFSGRSRRARLLLLTAGGSERCRRTTRVMRV